MADSDREGFVYYEWRRGYGYIELDFAVWVEGLGRFALQVKGDHYRLIDGDWHLKKREAFQHVASCPLDETKLAALDLHDDIEEQAETAYNPFAVPVLVFPDMEPDPVIEKLASRKGVYVFWRTGALVNDLTGIARNRGGLDALSMRRIPREVYAVTDGLIRLDRSTDNRVLDYEPEALARSAPRGAATLRLRVNGRFAFVVRGRALRLEMEPPHPRGDILELWPETPVDWGGGYTSGHPG